MRSWILAVVVASTLSTSLPFCGSAAAETDFDIDGQIRLRLEAWNFDRGLAVSENRLVKRDSDGFVLQRARIGVGASLAKDVRAYVLLQDTRNWGASGASATRTLSDLSNLDVHQAWGEVRHRYEKTQLRVRAGRQKLSYGIERIIGGLEWANPARAFDALKVQVKRSLWTLDLDAARVFQSPVTTIEGEGNDDVFVLHNNFDIPDRNVDVDAYVMYRDSEPIRTFVDSLVESTPGIYETTIGEHVAGNLGRWSFDQEFAYMLGKRPERRADPLVSADLNSYLFSLQVHVRLAERLKPTIGVGYDLLSGDERKGDGKNELFSIARIFHTGHKFYGLMDVAPFLAGAAGLRDPYGRIAIGGPRGLRAQAVVHVFSFDRPARFFEDAMQHGATQERSYLGTEVDATVSWLVANKTRLELGGGVLAPGDTLKETGTDDTVYWTYVQGLLTF